MIRLDQRSEAALATTLVAAPDTFNDGCEAPGGPRCAHLSAGRKNWLRAARGATDTYGFYAPKSKVPPCEVPCTEKYAQSLFEELLPWNIAASVPSAIEPAA